MITIEVKNNIIYTTAKGKLTKEDYQLLVPALRKLLTEHQKISWYFEMSDFKGWEPAALWEDISFDLKHRNDFEKVAMVGDKKWEQWLSLIMKPFTQASIKYFTIADKEMGLTWINE